MNTKKGVRGSILTFIADPFVVDSAQSYLYYEDGLVLLTGGKIDKVGPYKSLSSNYLATLGGAESIYLDDKIGSIAEGKEADMVAWDLHSTELIKYRMSFSKSLEEDLFTQLVMGDDRSVRATIVNGEVVYDRDSGFYKE